MARFRGIVQGGRGEATRLGHSTGGMYVCAQSYAGDVEVRMYAQSAPGSDRDMVRIRVVGHSTQEPSTVLYDGPVADLLNKDAKAAQIAVLAGEFLAGK